MASVLLLENVWMSPDFLRRAGEQLGGGEYNLAGMKQRI